MDQDITHWTDDFNTHLAANPTATDGQLLNKFPQLNKDPAMLNAAMSHNLAVQSGMPADQAATLHPELFSGGGGNAPAPAMIPRPNYSDPKSRLNYAKQWTQKYGPLMQGRGDTPLRANEIPDTATDTSKNLAVKFGSKLGLDPALLYSSAMEEGMSGLFPDKNNQVDTAGDPKFPVDGYASFGLDTFTDAYPGLVKKGYLSKDFAQNFTKATNTNEKKEKVNSANFTTVDAALEAKAAMMKDTQDQTEQWASKNKIPLSDRAKQFFTLVNYNAGEGNMRKMMAEYSKKGYLKDDSFIDKRPDDSWKAPWENVARRIKMSEALKKEGLF